jgi:hypothetical protein
MSEESLRQFLDRLNGDAAFVERLKANPGEALAEFDLSQTERVALATNDEDSLRRLAGQDVAAFINPAASHGILMGLPDSGCAQPIPSVACRRGPQEPPA